MSPINSNAMVLPSGETSSESQVPSSVVNEILRSDFSGKPFFSSFLSSFFSSFFSFSCAASDQTFSGGFGGISCVSARAFLARLAKLNINVNRYTTTDCRLGCFQFMLLSFELLLCKNQAVPEPRSPRKNATHPPCWPLDARAHESFPPY